MSAKGISGDGAKLAPSKQTTRKASVSQTSAKKTPSKAKTAGDGVKVSGNHKESANAATPNFGTWGASSAGLRRGQSGDDIKNLQNQLNAQGAGLKTDGQFGAKTEKALQTFQRRKGLEQDGVAGGSTQKQLDRGLTLPKDKFMSEGSQGSKVRGAQELMNRLGGDLKTDGKFGPKTQDAVKKLQRENGLKEDGIIGQETLKVLNGKGKAGEAKKAEPKTEPKVEPKKAETEPKKAEPKKTETEPKKAETEPKKTETEPKKAETEPKKTEAEPKKAEPKPEPKPEKPKEFAYLKDNVRQALEKSGKFEQLRKLPPEVSGMYDKMSPQARKEAGVQLSGSTWGVSHREAFVTGQAMGMDTFSYMGDKVKKEMAAGTMNAKEGEAMLKALPALRNLSSKQRDAIAEMLILQSR
ncbi:hypothetical protein ABS71_12755 [bacterium SCN 62-11]|nr:peptidoglycan-binding protein [Candidatus Eremiobacteraeota bacterium]ODT64736.1 MAG: hypothetical protein ABS71_12755 [bacterium SCN 62-11]